MIRHSGASAVVAFLDDIESNDPRVVLIRQYRYAAEGYVYEIPAGRLDEGEAPEACGHRELREETGYSAAELHPLTTFYTTPGFTDERIHLFAATGIRTGQSALEEDEILEVFPTPMSDAVRMVLEGEIVDGKTMIGILLASEYALKARLSSPLP